LTGFQAKCLESEKERLVLLAAKDPSITRRVQIIDKNGSVLISMCESLVKNVSDSS
jgi:hypothetical protein